ALDLRKTQIENDLKNRQSNRQKPEITRQGISTNSFSIPPPMPMTSHNPTVRNQLNEMRNCNLWGCHDLQLFVVLVSRRNQIDINHI
ncbi:hypothetical protein, partial [Gluconobacter kondonii]|uniref:hypothetical protein n=1 Tax=Gluconobacter kondonii TaxID=941463 RepID=UPI001B8D90B9